MMPKDIGPVPPVSAERVGNYEILAKFFFLRYIIIIHIEIYKNRNLDQPENDNR